LQTRESSAAGTYMCITDELTMHFAVRKVLRQSRGRAATKWDDPNPAVAPAVHADDQPHLHPAEERSAAQFDRHMSLQGWLLLQGAGIQSDETLAKGALEGLFNIKRPCCAWSSWSSFGASGLPAHS
jgi:hypothetical protein